MAIHKKVNTKRLERIVKKIFSYLCNPSIGNFYRDSIHK